MCFLNFKIFDLRGQDICLGGHCPLLPLKTPNRPTHKMLKKGNITETDNCDGITKFCTIMSYTICHI